jgi:ABC-type transport system involved in multi-copper enzyme maturation permease subunit
MTLTTARQMIGAEVLKLRRNRPLMAFALLLSVGIVMIVLGYMAIQHASNPSKYGPAGGSTGFDHVVRALGIFFGMLTAVLIGAEAGTADLSSGVFRDLVATGRSRLALFFVRGPAAILVTLAFTLSPFALGVAATYLLAGSSPPPTAGVVLQGLGWVVLCNVIMVMLAVGVGSLTGSRALTLTAVIGWQAVATNLLIGITSLGGSRDSLLTAALNQLIPTGGPGRGDVVMATGTAIVVLAAWLVIPTALGAWRARTQDA